MPATLFSQLLDADGAAKGAVWEGGAGSGVLLVDDRGRIRGLSDEAPGLLKMGRLEIIDREIVSLFRPADRARVERGLSLGPAAGPARIELEAGGALELRFGRRTRKRTPVLMLAVAAAEAAGEPAPPATAADVADLSHEMRTPLNAVIGFADAMIGETYGPLGHPKYAEYADIIRASGRHLLDLVNLMLDHARLEAGRYALKRETVDVGALARECAALMRIDAEKAGLKIAVKVGEPLPDVALDPRAVRQILINLLANAVKFTSDGEVSIDVRAEGEELLLVVADTGVGMGPEDLKKLGARFAKGADGVRGAKGTGLGLAVANALVELHGGRLALQSAPGEGVRAEARLPIVKPARPERRLRSVVESARADAAAPAILSQLERVEAYRRERSRSAA
jgi:cell cycle sensor histidine kinase DivJ